MKLSDLTPQVHEKIATYEWDRFIEKHEGPEKWSSVLRWHKPEFMTINGYDVLLPIDREQHTNITILRCALGDNAETLVIFLKDTTFVQDPKDERLAAGFVAICDRFPDEEFYLTIFYHEWYITENPQFP